MTEEQSIWMQTWQHERNLLTQRLMVFLTYSTILFLGFATLVSRESSWFCILVAFLGLVSSSLAFWHFRPIVKRLEKFEDERQIPENIKPLWEKYYKEVKGKLRGRKAPIVMCFIFCILWAASFAYSLCRLLAGV